MAAKKPAQPALDPDAQYRVKLSRPVRIKNRLYRPRDDIVAKGKLLAEFGDAVEKIEKV